MSGQHPAQLACEVLEDRSGSVVPQLPGEGGLGRAHTAAAGQIHAVMRQGW